MYNNFYISYSLFHHCPFFAYMPHQNASVLLHLIFDLDTISVGVGMERMIGQGLGVALALLIKITLTFYIGIRIGTKMSFLEMKILKIVVMKLP